MKTATKTSWKTWYRVDAVPWRWWPIYLPVSYFLAALLCLYVRVARRTCRIAISGAPHLATPHYLWALWHEDVWLSWVVLGNWTGHGWLNHPYWYMRPIHLAAGWDGVETLYLGSSGNDGRAALAKLIDGVKNGQQTMLMLDGPSGPRHKPRPGIVLVAAATGVPVVTLRFSSKRCAHLGGWDNKAFPIPLLSTIQLDVGPPTLVVPGEETAALVRIAEALGTSVR